MTKSPSGFFQSEAIFARNLFAMLACNLCRGSQASLVLRNIEISFVEGQRFNYVGMALEDFANLPGNCAIAREVRGQEDCVGAQTFGSNCGHSRTHAELSRFIRSSAHHRAIPAPCDDNGFAPELRIIPLLHGRIKRVHVDMNDLASGHLAPSYSGAESSASVCLFVGRLVS